MKVLLILSTGLCLANNDVIAEHTVKCSSTSVGKVRAPTIQGTWEATMVDAGTLPKGALVEFAPNGKLRISVDAGNQQLRVEGSYRVQSVGFTIEMKIGDLEHKETITITKLTDKELRTADKDGKVAYFTRKK